MERTRAQREGRTTGPETEDESAMSEALNPEFAGTSTPTAARVDPNTETEDNMSETSTGSQEGIARGMVRETDDG